MSISPGDEFRRAVTSTQGDEFRHTATPDQAMWRKQGYLSETDNGSVLTPGTGNNSSAAERRVTSAGGIADLVQILEQQRQHAEQIQALNERIDALDRASTATLLRAEERLAEIMRTANRTKDGRAVFQGEDGKIYDEFDNEVSADEIDGENWNPLAPSRGDHLDARQDVEEAREYHEQVLDLRARPTGELSEDDLADLEADLVALETSMAAPDSTKESVPTLPRTTSAAKAYDGSPDPVGASELQQPFSRAVAPADASALPDLATNPPDTNPTFTPR